MARLAGALLLVALPLAASSPARATFPGQNGLIAYTLSPDLWVVDPETRNARAVTAALGVRATDPAWAPDGLRLAFANVISTNAGIWVVRSDGTGATRLTTDVSDGHPAWSPDGARIAFVRRQDRFDRLFVMNADGSGVTAVTGAIDLHVQDPEWSPDGTQLVFSNGFDIHLVRPDGSGLTQLTGRGTPGELGGGRFPSWSPDGRTIAFSAVASIRVIGADGTGNRVLAGGLREVWEISWSPDGRRIAFVNDPGGAFQEELFVMNADGTGATQLGVDTETTLDWGVVPAAAPPPPPPAQPPPQSGKSVNVGPVSGVVRVRLRGTQRFVLLDASRQVPLGSELDATRGRVGVTAAIGGGRIQRGEFYQGRFVVAQPVGSAFATLRLTGPLVCLRRTIAGQAAPPRKRRLWGNVNGNFRTRGRFAVATVRGTVWLTEDRCDGTLVRVRTGRIQVRDLVRKRTVTLRAGQSYLVARRR